MSGKCGALQNAVDSYMDNVREIVDELNNFGDTALHTVQGGATDAGDMGFLPAIEDSLRSFVVGDGSGSAGIMGYMCALGIAIAVIFFLISVLQLVTEDKFTPEFLVKFAAKFIIALCVILWSRDILTYMIDFGDAFATDVANRAKGLLEVAETGTFSADALEKLIKNHWIYHYKNVGWDGCPGVGTKSDAKGIALWGIWESFQYWMEGNMLGIFKFVSFLLNAIVMFIVVTRVMELYVRGAFLPVAAGLMSDDGWRGAGGRYFRKLMSLATQNAAIMIVANVASVMISSALESIFTSSIISKLGIVDCAARHGKTLAEIANCPSCLGRIPAPIDLPVLKPMIICIVLCVAGLAMIFKTASLMDDIWGAR